MKAKAAKGKAAASAQPAAKKTAVPKKPKGESTGRDPEANRFFRCTEILMDDPEMTLEALEKAVGKAGHEYSERSVLRAHEAWRGIYGALKKNKRLRNVPPAG